MNQQQRKILTDFATNRKHVVIDGCPDPDCKAEWKKSLAALMKLCGEAEAETRRLERRKKAK